MVKHTQTIRCQKPRNCLRVFDNFVGLVPKGLKGDSGAVFFCEFCETFKNNYFLEHIRMAASNLSSSVFGKFLICDILDSHCGVLDTLLQHALMYFSTFLVCVFD